jgi:hypothetical protein
MAINRFSISLVPLIFSFVRPLDLRSDSCGDRDSLLVCPSPDFACAARVDFDLQFSVSCGGDFSVWAPSAVRFRLDLSVPPSRDLLASSCCLHR